MVIRLFRNAPAAVLFLMLCSVPADPCRDASTRARALAIEAERDARNILDSLRLGYNRKSEIHSVLPAAIESMDAVNVQLGEMQTPDPNLLSEGTQGMIPALRPKLGPVDTMLIIPVVTNKRPIQTRGES